MQTNSNEFGQNIHKNTNTQPTRLMQHLKNKVEITTYNIRRQYHV